MWFGLLAYRQKNFCLTLRDVLPKPAIADSAKFESNTSGMRQPAVRNAAIGVIRSRRTLSKRIGRGIF
jgi:hypothetical protein